MGSVLGNRIPCCQNRICEMEQETLRKVGEMGMIHNVPVQSLIDHIKTAIDVDPWAKEMAEELLKEQPEIVRCRDCKNADYGTDEDGNRFMKCIGSVKCYGGTTPDWFCADGQRKTDNG